MRGPRAAWIPGIFACLMLACSANDGNVDAKDGPAQDTASPEEIAGCEWAAGDWDFTTCNGQKALVTMKLDGCELDLESGSELYDQAVGQVRDAGVYLALPTGDACHGAYNGQELSGACGTLLTICAFTAQKR